MSKESYKNKADREVERRWLSVAEASHYLGVHADTVRRLISRGELRGYRIAGVRAVRVDRRDVDKLLRPVPAAELASLLEDSSDD